MSNEVKEPKTKDKKNKDMIEIAFVSAAVEKGGKILDKMFEGKSILEYSLSEAELSIKLENNGIDKDGNRYDPNTKYIISVKGNPQKPKTNKKANIKGETDKEI